MQSGSRQNPGAFGASQIGCSRNPAIIVELVRDTMLTLRRVPQLKKTRREKFADSTSPVAGSIRIT